MPQIDLAAELLPLFCFRCCRNFPSWHHNNTAATVPGNAVENSTAVLHVFSEVPEYSSFANWLKIEIGAATGCSSREKIDLKACDGVNEFHIYACLPPRYRDSVRAITPGLPLFLYNYTTHQLHGIFDAASFGGSNIDPTAWEDKKCKGESRFPAQVRIRVRKLCKPLEEDAFRPVLHHYDGPKFRLELSIAETLALLDLCEKEGI
ncbi:hypothetical protein KFK09_015963 [Dendrobium nobile]|uniref:DCD domain-containing protein n=1 Tax=Dendrobium nobile TaxID=94219 RepID=A0A8T3BBY6_DENNO|nr:hypothetical protein KFK09_015963 [Dendrobium nobile]